MILLKKTAPNTFVSAAIPMISEVINTDLVSRNTKKVDANHTKFLVVLAMRLFTKRWRKIIVGESVDTSVRIWCV